MAGASNLFNRVAQLVGRGYTRFMDVVNKIRGTPPGRNITTKAIRSNYDKYAKVTQAAKQVPKLLPAQPISSVLSRAIGLGAKSIQVGFKFQFDFGSAGSLQKQGRQSVYMVVDVSKLTTKKELMALIKEKVNQWIEAHYTNDPEGRNSVRITIHSIMGI